MTTLRADITAMQSDISEHADAVERTAEIHGVNTEIVEIRSDGLVSDYDVLLIPGGESTTISRFLEREDVVDEIRVHVEAEKSTLTTCAGLVVVSHDARDDRVTTPDLLDTTVDRNAFGRQVDSFEAPPDMTGPDSSFPAIFIRMSFIDEVGEGAEVPAEWGGNPVVVRDGPAVGTSFHPELTFDSCLHGLTLFDELAVEIDI